MKLITEEINFNNALNGAEPSNNAIAASTLDFNALRLSQDYTQAAGVEKLLTTVPVRKPNKTEFVRVHPDRAAPDVIPSSPARCPCDVSFKVGNRTRPRNAVPVGEIGDFMPCVF